MINIYSLKVKGVLYMNAKGSCSVIIAVFCLILLLTGIFTVVLADENINAPSKTCTRSPRSRAWVDDEKMGGIDVSDLARNQVDPAVISDGEKYTYCVWSDDRNGDWNIYFTKSANAGNVWSTNVHVINATVSLGDQKNPMIALNPANGSHIYLVWQDDREVDDDGDIYFSYSIDRGDSWANETLVNTMSQAKTTQWYPAVACDRLGNIYVVWSDDSGGDWDVQLSRSTDNGKTWSPPQLVNDLFLNGKNQLRPDLVVDDNGIIYVAWEDDRIGNNQIYFSRSKNQGAAFSKDTQVSSVKTLTAARKVDLEVDRYNNIFVVWMEDSNSQYNVHFSNSLDNGAHFSTPIRVNDEENVCAADADPVVLADDYGNIYAAWADKRAENHIYIGHSPDSGKSFSVNEKVDDADDTKATVKSTTTKEQLERGQPQLIRLKNKLQIFWTDYINDPNPDDGMPQNGDIYFDWNLTLPNTKPEKPQFDTGKITHGWWFINLTWQISTDLDFLKYKVYNSIVKDFTPDDATIHSTYTDRGHNFANITGLAPASMYYFKLIVEDKWGLTSTSDQLAYPTKINTEPTIELLQPNGSINDLADESFEIVWNDYDPDDNATIKLYYDTNQNAADGKNLIVIVPYGEDSAKNFYIWDTHEIQNGSYYVVAMISDPINGEGYPVYSYGKVSIYHGNLDPFVRVMFISPRNISNVQPTTSIVLLFNKDLDMSTVHQDSFVVTDRNGFIVPGEFSFESETNKLRFDPDFLWNGSEHYQVRLTTAIRDATGLFKLEHEYLWWFETGLIPVNNGTIEGEIVDEYWQNPVKGAIVTLIDTEDNNNTWNTTTDANGDFVFIVGYGQYELYVYRESFQSTEKIIINLTQVNYPVKTIELIQPFINNFEINKNKLTLDDNLKVSAIATHINNEQLTYTWDFGDGTVQVGENVSHKFKKPGEYNVILTVTDENNGTVTQSTIVTVESAREDLLYFFVGIAIVVLVIGLILIFFVLVRARKQFKEKREKSDSRVELEKVEAVEIGEEEIDASETKKGKVKGKEKGKIKEKQDRISKLTKPKVITEKRRIDKDKKGERKKDVAKPKPEKLKHTKKKGKLPEKKLYRKKNND